MGFSWRVLALAVSLEHYSQTHNDLKSSIIGAALDDATEQLLIQQKSPSRKANELDNRGSHFYLSLFWAEALSNQDKDEELKIRFSLIAEQLRNNESIILKELDSVQGMKVDIGGYYLPDNNKANKVMRPSNTFNSILDQ